MSEINGACASDSGPAIEALRAELGQDLVIVGHHYQGDDIVEHVDHTGDSLELARMIEGIKARHIVFCGVHFMAESARLLAAADQAVHLPVLEARCTMSDTTPAPLLEAVLARLERTGRRIVPLAYVNTSLAVKAVVGRHGGAVCTSANAPTMLKWALGQGDAVLFLPDHNLGNNTADQLGLPQERRHILNIRQGGNQVNLEAARKATLLLWPGCCPIHAVFKPEMADDMRRLHPGARVIVHPECTPEMVGAADAAGSTSFIIRQAEAAPDGSTLVVGTEINLVRRLTARHAGRAKVVPLAVSACCSNMTKIRPAALLRTLRAIHQGTAQPLQIDAAQAGPARDALTRMLQQCA